MGSAFVVMTPVLVASLCSRLSLARQIVKRTYLSRFCSRSSSLANRTRSWLAWNDALPDAHAGRKAGCSRGFDKPLHVASVAIHGSPAVHYSASGSIAACWVDFDLVLRQSFSTRRPACSAICVHYHVLGRLYYYDVLRWIMVAEEADARSSACDMCRMSGVEVGLLVAGISCLLRWASIHRRSSSRCRDSRKDEEGTHR
jgi:hypothetical protein